jgi:hypothetical protein
MVYFGHNGAMAEWFKAAVLKTAVALHATGGSNPSRSAENPHGEVPEWMIGTAC